MIVSSLDRRILDAAPFQLGFDSRVIVAANVGSHSHGTYIPKDDAEGIDDVDILGAIMPPIDCIIGLNEFEHWTDFIDELDVTFYSFQKLVRLWLKSNPNVLGLLWMRDEDFIERSEVFDSFRAEREAFVCTQVVDAFAGYAWSQLRDIQRNRHEGYMGTKRKVLVERFGYDIKHAAHLIRLLRMSIEFLQEGTLNVYRTHDADELKSIKRGEWSMERVQIEAANLFEKADALKAVSKLPEKPNRDKINRLLVSTMRGYVSFGPQGELDWWRRPDSNR